jgi:predicted Mrr-cat superfamily restriction endonuclease
MDFKIEKGIVIPSKSFKGRPYGAQADHTANIRTLLKSMEVGDSIAVPFPEGSENTKGITGKVQGPWFYQAKKAGVTLTGRTMKEGDKKVFRIWRVK